MKVLNLYAGIGGNREFWPSEVNVTAVENNPKIAAEYAERFPEDEVVVTDALEYLQEHIDDGWDFIWSSPPCQTHSRANYFIKARKKRVPDMTQLYGAVVFLQAYAECPWVVENVIPWYNDQQPLIYAQKVGRHLFWANFRIPPVSMPDDDIGKMCGKNQKAHSKRVEERNAVYPPLGLHILRCGRQEIQEVLV